MDDFDKIIAQANCIVNSDKTVDEMENMKLTIANLQGQLSSARSEGYKRCAEDVKENTVKMIAEGVQRGYSEGYVKALDDVMGIFKDSRPVEEFSVEFYVLKVAQLKSAYLGGTDDKTSS